MQKFRQEWNTKFQNTVKLLAYADLELPLGHGQSMMKPVVEGRTLQALKPQAGEDVLENGTGSGYLTACLAQLGGGHPLAAADRIELAAKLSVHVVRNGSGPALAYDPAENFHRDHILDVSIVPARLDPKLLEQARTIALRVAEALDYHGLLAVEFFLSGDGRLLVNEMAPRPHNSGHHTIDACETSQFEQQLRVLCGLTPGSTRLHSPTVMLNLLGDVWEDATGKPNWPAVLAMPGAHLPLYDLRLISSSLHFSFHIRGVLFEL